jgi:hypothetical protein
MTSKPPFLKTPKLDHLRHGRLVADNEQQRTRQHDLRRRHKPRHRPTTGATELRRFGCRFGDTGPYPAHTRNPRATRSVRLRRGRDLQSCPHAPFQPCGDGTQEWARCVHYRTRSGRLGSLHLPAAPGGYQSSCSTSHACSGSGRQVAGCVRAPTTRINLVFSVDRAPAVWDPMAGSHLAAAASGQCRGPPRRPPRARGLRGDAARPTTACVLPSRCKRSRGVVRAAGMRAPGPDRANWWPGIGPSTDPERDPSLGGCRDCPRSHEWSDRANVSGSWRRWPDASVQPAFKPVSMLPAPSELPRTWDRFVPQTDSLSE